MKPALQQKKARTSKAYLFALVVIALFILVAIFAPLLAPHDPNARSFKISGLPPMWVHNDFMMGTADHPLGTDRLGRDILSRYLFGVRTAVLLAFCAIPATALLGIVVGMISGYFGGKTDNLLVLVMDIVQSLPGIMFVVIIILILRNLFPPVWFSGCLVLIIGFSAVSWVGLARMVRAQVLQLKNELFFEAAVALGATRWRIITRHLFPNVAHLVLVWIANNVPAIILLEGILGYIGVSLVSAGADNEFTVMSWGGLFYTGRSTLSSNPMILLVPAASLLLLSMSFVLIGDHYHRKFSR